MKFCFLFISLILSGCVVNPNDKVCPFGLDECFEKLSSKKVILSDIYSPPLFYKVMDNNFVLFFDPEDLLESLNKWGYSKETKSFILALNSILPLKENTDVLKFRIDSGTPIYSLDLALAELIEDGKVSIFDLDKEYGYEDTVRVDVLKGAAKYRFFYIREFILFSVMDEIYDY